MKLLDCFLDGHGNYTGNLISFYIKIFANNPFFQFQRDSSKSFGSAYDVVIKHIKNPIATRNAISKKVEPNVRQTHATHS